AGFVFAFNDEVGVGPGVIDVAFINQKLFEDVVVAPNDFVLSKRILRRENRGLLFVINSHVTTRFFEQVLVVMSQQHDRLLRVIDESVGEIRLVIEDQRDAILAWNIFRGDDREFIPGNEVSTTCGSGWVIRGS